MTGKDFKALRNRFNLNQKEMAKLLGVSSKTCARYEANHFKAIPTILKLAVNMLTINLSMRNLKLMNKEEIIEFIKFN